MQLLEELVRCRWTVQGGSGSALERAQGREQDQGRREATTHERRPREAPPCLSMPPPALSHLPAAPACPGRRPATEQRAGEAGEAGESQERKAREGKAHTQRRAARRRRRARSAAQTSCNGRITAARAAGCLWWPWRCYAPPSPLCSPVEQLLD